MKRVTLQTHIGSDGLLRLELPVGMTDVDLEVTVTMQPLTSTISLDHEELGWPPDFFEQTYGILRDVPLERGDQGEYEVRESLISLW